MKQIAALMLAALVMLTACVSGSKPETSSSSAPPGSDPGPRVLKVGDVLFIANGWAIETDDAFRMSRWGMVEPLVRVDFDGQLKPQLAVSWTQTDPLTWEFKLRSGVSFQNGEPFNAAAVVKAFEYLLQVPTPPRGFGAQNIAGIEAVGDDLVRIRTSEPDTLVPARLASPNTAIMAPSAYRPDGTIDPFGTGTGPFILKEFVPDQKAVLLPNPNYWNGTAGVDEAQVLWVPDSVVRAGMVSTGELDIARSIPISEIPVIERDPNVNLLRVDLPRTRTLYMNNKQGPLSDVRVRQAVLHAINKQALVDAILEGVGTASVGPFPTDQAWTERGLRDYEYNPDRAVQLLTEAGYERDQLRLAVWTYPARAELPPMATAIQNMLSKVGIVAEVRVAPYSVLEPDVLAGKYDLFLNSRGHLIDAYDPLGFLAADYSCAGSYNLSLYCNEQVDSALARAKALADPAERYAIYRQVQTTLHEQAVSGFLSHTAETYASRKTVSGYQEHPLDYYLLTTAITVSR